MGWQIKTNNKDQWSLFSSITDSNIVTFEKQKDLVNFIALEKVYEGKKKAIEILMTFPNGWTVNDSRIFVGDEGSESRNKHNKYFAWLNSICDCETYEEYYKMIDNKLDELMK